MTATSAQQDTPPVKHIKVLFQRPDNGQQEEVGVILYGEFGAGFAYLPTYQGPPIDPVNLDYRVGDQRLYPARAGSEGLAGVFRDCLPSGFAHSLLCHDYPEYHRQRDYERLFWLGSRTHGPFTFKAMDDIGRESAIQGEKHLDQIRKRLVGFHLDPSEFRETRVLSTWTRWALTHDGGTQPKCLYEDTAFIDNPEGGRAHERRRWLAKFNVEHVGETHFENTARVEAAMLELSAACGIATPERRVLKLPSGADVFLIRRFDEADTEKGVQLLHRVSFTTLTGLDNTGRRHAGQADFKDILQVIREVSADPVADTDELYRRMIFHVATRNYDNHLLNFEMVLQADGWRLAPSYDTLPDPDPAQANPFATTVCGDSFPVLGNDLITRTANAFGFSQRHALEIALQVVQSCREVDKHLDLHEVPLADRARIHHCMGLERLQTLETELAKRLDHAAQQELDNLLPSSASVGVTPEAARA
jgi:hypothetical protein